ncbi:MAG: hypothetical protein IKG71_01125 [Firmicutes bacterium]|nr:hypothetical protein [Bacillota bacterium]
MIITAIGGIVGFLLVYALGNYSGWNPAAMRGTTLMGAIIGIIAGIILNSQNGGSIIGDIKRIVRSAKQNKQQRDDSRLERERIEREEMERQREFDDQAAEQEQQAETKEEKWDPATVKQIRTNKIINLIIAIAVFVAVIAIIIWRTNTKGV